MSQGKKKLQGKMRVNEVWSFVQTWRIEGIMADWYERQKGAD